MKLNKIFTVLVGIYAFLSCNKDNIKSLSELKKDQSSNIAQTIRKNGWTVRELKTEALPSTIDNNVYYHFPNGLYMKIIDAGSEEKAIKNQTQIELYIKGYLSHKDNNLYGAFNSISDAQFMPIEFLYTEYYNQGDIHYRSVATIQNGLSLSDLLCEGLAFPMTMLGNGAKVSLIIPFELGPSFTYQTGSNIVIEEARYNFNIN